MRKTTKEPSSKQKSARRDSSKPVAIVGIGASAGGFEAFKQLLKALPADTGMAYVFVQHLEARHESMLAKLLASSTAMPTTEVRSRTLVEADHLYVISPNTDLRLENGELHVVRRKSGRELHLPIDDFFQSLAQDRGSHAIGVVLSGTASDGTFGLRSIRAEGGITFAQDPETAQFDGMPSSAIMADCVDFVLSPKRIAAKLVEIGRHPGIEFPPLHANLDLPDARDGDWPRLFRLLKMASGVDFTFYKKSTIRRRVARRMAMEKIEKLEVYLKVLQSDREELLALQEDLLIHVTSFFREPAVFAVFQKTILPKILKRKQPGEPLRIWVAGSSTGEEVYSLAICLFEALDRIDRPIPLQLFGTDVSDKAIEKARKGIYPAGAMSEVSPARLKRFFTRVDGSYQINSNVRDACVFARHDLIKDPPFSNMDVVACRNVLIYLEPVLQKRVLSSFHYALKDSGILFLGKSETLGNHSEMFSVLDRKNKFFTKRHTKAVAYQFSPPAHETFVPGRKPQAGKSPVFDLDREADRYVWERYGHAGLVIDNELHILQFRGDTSRYLRPVPGKATFQLLRMLREEFILEVRSGIQKARKTGTAVRAEAVRATSGGKPATIQIEVLPLRGPQREEQFFLILFEESFPRDGDPQPSSSKREMRVTRDSIKLQNELARTREYLQSIIQEQESTNEELKTANEEALSSMEELQSSNEELETAKEELQSTNEELTTLNEQLQTRNVELARATDDLTNLLSSINIPIVMLTADQRLRRFTPAAEKTLSLIPADVGRPLNPPRIGFKMPDLENELAQVMNEGEERAREVKAENGRWYSVRLFPYRSAEHGVNGVLIAFIDIDELRRSQEAVKKEIDLTTATLNAATDLLVVVRDRDGRIVRFNRACQALTGYSEEEVQGRHTWEFLVPRDAVVEARAAFTKARAGIPSRIEYPWSTRDGRQVVISWSITTTTTTTTGENVIEYVVSAGIDITERKNREAIVRSMTARLLSMQEHSGKTIARELHDGITQRLAALSMETTTLLKAEPGLPPGVADRILELGQKIGALTEDVHWMSRRLHPKILDDLGLEAAIREECLTLSKLLGTPVHFEARDMPRFIPEDTALCFFRVAQESLHNVAKHAQATEVSVFLKRTSREIFLTVEDKGVGFDLDQARHKGGLGLVSMEERIRLAGGKFNIHSQPGKGTRIEAQVPLPEKPQ